MLHELEERFSMDEAVPWPVDRYCSGGKACFFEAPRHAQGTGGKMGSKEHTVPCLSPNVKSFSGCYDRIELVAQYQWVNW